MIVVARRKTAMEQIRLHVIMSVAEAVINHSVPQPGLSVPQFVPAGLGSCTPAVSKGDVSGSTEVQKLTQASIAAEVLGRESDVKRLRTWEKNLLQLDTPNPPSPIEVWEKDQRLQMTDGARVAHQRRLQQTVAEQKRYVARLEKQNDPDLEHQRRILSRLRAQLAASKPRKVQGQRIRIPNPVYLIRIPSLSVTAAGIVWCVPGQKVELDLRAGYRTPAQEKALEILLEINRMPVSTRPAGELRRAPDTNDVIWIAWNALADSVMDRVVIEQVDVAL